MRRRCAFCRGRRFLVRGYLDEAEVYGAACLECGQGSFHRRYPLVVLRGGRP